MRLGYMGTSTVVRDIEEMSRVLEGPKAKINFIGFVRLRHPRSHIFADFDSN